MRKFWAVLASVLIVGSSYAEVAATTGYVGRAVSALQTNLQAQIDVVVDDVEGLDTRVNLAESDIQALQAKEELDPVALQALFDYAQTNKVLQWQDTLNPEIYWTCNGGTNLTSYLVDDNAVIINEQAITLTHWYFSGTLNWSEANNRFEGVAGGETLHTYINGSRVELRNSSGAPYFSGSVLTPPYVFDTVEPLATGLEPVPTTAFATTTGTQTTQLHSYNLTDIADLKTDVAKNSQSIEDVLYSIGLLQGESIVNYQLATAAQAAVDTHVGDTSVHVTAEDKTAWNGKVSEAPVDGKSYARKDGSWSEVVSGGGSTLVCGGYAWFNTAFSVSALVNLPVDANIVTYFTVPVTQLPTTTGGVTVDTTAGTVTVPVSGTYQVTYSTTVYPYTSAQIKRISIVKNGVDKISYAPILIKMPTSNAYMPYSNVETFSLTAGDVLHLNIDNGGQTGTAYSYLWFALRLEVLKIN